MINGTELLNKCLKSAWIKGEVSMPISPLNFLGKTPYGTKETSNTKAKRCTNPIIPTNTVGKMIAIKILFFSNLSKLLLFYDYCAIVTLAVLLR